MTLSVGELRHDLRTPVNHIVGYAEMLLEDASEPAYASCRSALEDTLQAAREVTALINAALNPARTEVSPEELGGLYRSMKGPQGRILVHMRALLGSDSLPPVESFGQDLLRIKAAAERLIPADLAAQAPAAAPAGPETKKKAGSGAKVLVVDDVEDNREVLRRRLEREGYAVTSAGDGREALTRIGEAPFDLVLLDVMMPELDGYAVLEKLKSDAATRDIPVIMISAMDDMPSVVRCIERGAEDFLPKPFDAVLLRARISASLEKKRLRDQEKRYLEEVQQVIEAASAVESGHYTAGSLASIAHRDDALGRLARVFDGMVTQVKEREERLRKQIRELRGDIDVARRETADFAATMDAGNLTTGARFAERYEIVQVVGRGGMGTVYRARDLELEQDVAIKTLRSEFLADDSILERFKSEIRLTYRITHRNVVRTHYFGEWKGVYYLTMEFVEGVTLRQLMDTRGRLSVPSTLAIGIQLAESLASAHEQGVIHRDIKPQNLLLDPEGVLKVMDFGIARLAERGPVNVTEVGLVVGTPAYASPEQLLADEVDARSDLYSTGLVLYECLTGRLPFEAKSAIALISKVFTEVPVPPAQVNPEIPSALSTLVLKLMARTPEDRVQSARELAKQLGNSPSSPNPLSPFPCQGKGALRRKVFKMFSLYLTLKFIHVVAVIFWIGGITAMTVWTVRAGRDPDHSSLAVTLRHALFYGERVVGPASGVVLLAGIAMVISAHIRFATPWIIWGMAGILTHVILAVTVLRKNGERLAQLAGSATPDPVELNKVLRRQKITATIYVVIMLSVVWAMVTKPT